VRGKVLFVLGTRPEAIKLCPVIVQLQKQPERFEVRVCVTAQHRELLDQVLDVFQVVPDWDLDLMRPGQTLFESTSRILSGLEPVVQAERPAMILVQGDTTTTFCGALAGFYCRVPVGHVEAGLRTGDRFQPFPEEINRVLTTHLSSLHFAATESAAANLRAEGVPAGDILVTGNPGIDAVLYVREALEAGRLPRPQWPFLDPAKRLILVTAHRRESFGEGFERICAAVAGGAGGRGVPIGAPFHPNPTGRGPVRRHLAGLANVFVIEPLDYIAFGGLMCRADILLTDSGGIQEEGPSLGKPVLVMREKTERPEAVAAGTARLVGTDPERITGETLRLLADPAEYERMSRVHNPYGDGRAGSRIGEAIYSFLNS